MITSQEAQTTLLFYYNKLLMTFLIGCFYLQTTAGILFASEHQSNLKPIWDQAGRPDLVNHLPLKRGTCGWGSEMDASRGPGQKGTKRVVSPRLRSRARSITKCERIVSTVFNIYVTTNNRRMTSSIQQLEDKHTRATTST